MLTAILVFPALRVPAFFTTSLGLATGMMIDLPTATTSEVLAFM